MKRLTLLTSLVIFSLILTAQPQHIKNGFETNSTAWRLGNPKPESPIPQQCPAPKSYGWWQAFDLGWIYYSPTYGFIKVTNPIFAKWAEFNWEQGSLGFPISFVSLKYNNIDGEELEQRFEKGKITYSYRTQSCTVYFNANPIRDGIYRLLLLGFKVNNPTSDDPLEWDGKGDEIFIRADILEMDINKSITVQRHIKTPVIGDINNDDWSNQGPNQRIRGGSASSLGGLKKGDMVPTQTPWTEAYRGENRRFPFALWSGRLTDEKNILIIPSIWEWDNNKTSNWEANWSNIINQQQLNQKFPFNAYFSTAGDYTSITAKDASGNIPIGLIEQNLPSGQRFVLNLPTIKICSAGFSIGNEFDISNSLYASSPYGSDIFPIEIQSEINGRASYTLFLKWQRL